MNNLLLNILQKLLDLLCISPYTIFNEEKNTSRTYFQVGAQFISISPDAWACAGLLSQRAGYGRIGLGAARRSKFVEGWIWNDCAKISEIIDSGRISNMNNVLLMWFSDCWKLVVDS